MQLTFFCFAKRKSPKKRRRYWLRPSASLRATCGARSSRGQKQLASLKQVFALIRLALRSSAHPEGVGEGIPILNTKQPKTETRIPEETRTRHGESLLYWGLVFVFGPRSRLALLDAPRSAGSGGSGIALFERSEFRETPPEPSTAGCPGAQRRDAASRVAFLLLTFLWRSKEK